MKEYKALETNEARHEEVKVRLHRIKQSLTPDKQAHVISDLVAISAADGRVKEGEERFIAVTAQVFGFE